MTPNALYRQTKGREAPFYWCPPGPYVLITLSYTAAIQPVESTTWGCEMINQPGVNDYNFKSY
jgi:hypothetical protein